METRSNDHLTVGQKQHVKVGVGQFVETGNEIHYYAGNKVVIDAGMELTAVGGGSFLKLDPGGVTLGGATIKINSGGASGKGTGIGIVAPKLPLAADSDQAGALLQQALDNYVRFKGRVHLKDLEGNDLGGLGFKFIDKDGAVLKRGDVAADGTSNYYEQDKPGTLLAYVGGTGVGWEFMEFCEPLDGTLTALDNSTKPQGDGQ